MTRLQAPPFRQPAPDDMPVPGSPSLKDHYVSEHLLPSNRDDEGL